jgi:hypothetical protein
MILVLAYKLLCHVNRLFFPVGIEALSQTPVQNRQPLTTWTFSLTHTYCDILDKYSWQNRYHIHWVND